MPKLVIRTGEKKALVYRLTERNVSIGRDPSNMIILTDHRVSRKHAQIVLKGKEYVIEDLGSSNGTMVNNSLVTRQVLKPGDEIRLGGTVLAFLSLSTQEKVGEEAPPVRVIPEEEAIEGPTVEMAVAHEKVKPIEAELVKPDVGALQKAYQRLMVLYRISYDLGTLMELPRLLDKMLELVLDVIKADRGFIMLIDEETGELVPQAVRRSGREGLKEDKEITVSKTITNRVLKTGESVLTRDAMQDIRFKKADSIILHGIRSAMCVPIKTKEKILGIMQVDTKARTLGFTKEDLELLTAMCNQAAVAVENVKLFDDLRKANKELKERQAQLIEAEKLSALGQLASGVAHEINNPLTNIISYTELSSERLAKGRISQDELKKCVEFLRIVETEGYHCKKIAQNLLHFARRKKAEMAPIDINNVIEATLAMAQYHMKKGQIEVVKNLAPGLPRIMADRGQLQQVFLNMILNARDAIEKRGILTITTTKIEDKSRTKNLVRDKWVVDKFPLTQSQAKLGVEVKFIDTGCGIPEDKMEDIFKPLYTTKEEGKGTGLGLSITKEIIELHKGTIDVESTVGKGTTFAIRLPLHT